MSDQRALRLSKESLTELTCDEMAALAGGTFVTCQSGWTVCELCTAAVEVRKTLTCTITTPAAG